MGDSQQISRRLYKYRSIFEPSREYTARIITDHRIYYASPDQFNDPFDCQFSVNMDDAPLNSFGMSKRDEIKLFTEKFLAENVVKNWSVLSLSELNDDILMWSHYADSHQGICLELTFDPPEQPHQVQYSDVRPQFYFADSREQDRNHDRFTNSILSTLKTKAVQWEYEKEWRCILFGGSGERPMIDGMLTGIIFGCRTSERDQQMVRDWVGSSGRFVKFYRAEKRDGAFALNIKELT